MINKKTFSSGGILSHCCCFICPGLKSTFIGLLPPSQYFEKKKAQKRQQQHFLLAVKTLVAEISQMNILNYSWTFETGQVLKKKLIFISSPLTDCHHPRYGVNIKTVRSGCEERKGLSFLSSHRDVCVSCPLWCVAESNKRWQRHKGKYLVISSMPFTQLIPRLISSPASSRVHFTWRGGNIWERDAGYKHCHLKLFTLSPLKSQRFCNPPKITLQLAIKRKHHQLWLLR